MISPNKNPKWWQLYLTFPLLIALFMMDDRLKISARGHQTVQIGIVFIVYGLVHFWLKANWSALSKLDQRQYHRTITVIQIPSYYPPATSEDKPTMIALPESEIKGMLSDTFEMNTIDAEAFPVDEVSQELNKE